MKTFYWGLLFAAFACVAPVRSEEAVRSPFSLIEVTSYPEEHEQTVFTIRFAPVFTHECDVIEIEAVYRQSFPWENFRGEAYTKIHEPVRFMHRRENIRLIAQLDWYVSFRVPTARRLLDETYGERTFNRQHPVTVDRFVINGRRGDETLWRFEVPAKGEFKGEDLEAMRCKKPRPRTP